MNIPLIFDIRRTSTVDGPGVRTTVFFKGCELNCFWCHNPEGKSPKPQLAFFEEKCVGCGACQKVCESKEKCITCGKCAEACPREARKLYGKSYTADELFCIIERDRPYYDATGGGVTFSGGECMLYPDFVSKLAEKCKKNGISVAIDTAGDVPFEIFEKVIPYTDIFLYDIKALDPELHEKGTGRTNERILDNLNRLIEKGQKIIIRTPVIDGFNDLELEKIREFAEKRSLTVEFLPYHAMGESKEKALK